MRPTSRSRWLTQAALGVAVVALFALGHATAGNTADPQADNMTDSHKGPGPGPGGPVMNY